MRRIGRAIRAFWSELRRKATEPGQLREFVYLDETSVESLLASLDGEVLTGITESRSKGYELGLSATGAAPGVPTGFSPSARRTRSVTIEEQRKSVAQSAFARLRSRHYRSLRLEADQSDNVGARKDFDPEKDLAVISIRRGDLVEVDAILSASEVFRVKTVIDSMIGVVNAFPELMPPGALAAMREGEPIGALLGSLSQGLIPIEGTIVGYKSVSSEGQEWIVPDTVANEMGRNGATIQDVTIASVTLSPLYWQDTRRVLFSQSRYRLLGRLVHDGVKSSWSAVKVTDVLRDINAELSDTLNALGPMFLKALQEGDDGNTAPAVLEPKLVALLPYARELADRAGVNWTPDFELRAIDALPQESTQEQTAETWRENQTAMDDLIFANTYNRVTPQVLSQIRQHHPLPIAGTSDALAEETNVSSELPPSAPPRRYLELEVIAIYW